MGMMDDMKDKASNMSQDQIQARVSELMDKEKRGELSDQGREELNMLRGKMK